MEVVLVGRPRLVGGLGPSRVATATTRAPSANSPSSVASASAGTSTQRARSASGAPLVTRTVSSVVGSDHDRGELAFVVEREQPEPFVPGGRIGAGLECGCGGRGPQSGVEGVAADRSGGGDRRLVAHQPEQKRPVGGLAGRVEGLVEGDGALGERAGLVGEQHLDVAEVLDGDEPLDEHPLAGELP